MNDWHNVYITDKSGKKGYEFIDKESAKLMLDGSPYQTMDDILDDDLLKELLD